MAAYRLVHAKCRRIKILLGSARSIPQLGLNAPLLACALLGACTSGEPEHVELGSADYHSVNFPACPSDSPTGPAGATNKESLTDRVMFSVRTPKNYDPSLKHPLIVVYSPAGHNRFASESLTKLTLDATRMGFIISFVDSVRLSVPSIRELSLVPVKLAGKWCIDPERIFLTGHSDGGTVASAIGFLPEMAFKPRAIAPSAAGIRAEDISTSNSCSTDISVLTIQNEDDSLFPDYGRGLAAWWANCNSCQMKPIIDDEACHHYIGCAQGVQHRFCNYPGSHTQWPNANANILRFFAERLR